MRAENDHVVGNSVESCKDKSKPQNCPEEKWEDGGELKGLENGKNDNNVCELFYDTRSGEEWDKESAGNHSCEAGKKLGVDNIDAKNGSLETADPVFFMDKNVTACDLPEIVVCYKEGTYHVVKDICVDEGVPVQEKFLFGEKGSVKCSSDSDQCDSEGLVKADKEIGTNSSEENGNSKVDSDSELCNDPKSHQDVEESPREEFADAEGTSSCCKQEHLIVTREAKDSSKISHEIEEAATLENVPKESLTLGDILSWEDEPKPLDNNNNSNRLEEQSPPQLQEKERDESKKAEEEKLSSVPTTISQEPNKTFNDNQQPNLLVGDSLEDNKLIISGGFGETSFSAAEAVSISGHITYTGPIAFSGSLSVRSDASTTSGRSFAFPVLQSEWNSSPVRMAKPEKRRHKGWKQILLCCRSS